MKLIDLKQLSGQWINICSWKQPPKPLVILEILVANGQKCRPFFLLSPSL